MKTDKTNKKTILFAGAFVAVVLMLALLDPAEPIKALGVGISGANEPKVVVSNTTKSLEDSVRATPPAGIYMDDQERALYAQDPSSAGYTDSDRDFLKETGVSEQEMRAMETILHENGLD
jgi:hypothetical protein